eukprot:273624-Chlamydomonas_euryale.AAC.2
MPACSARDSAYAAPWLPTRALATGNRAAMQRTGGCSTAPNRGQPPAHNATPPPRAPRAPLARARPGTWPPSQTMSRMRQTMSAAALSRSA